MLEITNISKSNLVKIYEEHNNTIKRAKTPQEAYHVQLNVTAKERNIKHERGIKMMCSNNMKGYLSIDQPSIALLSDTPMRSFLLVEIPTQLLFCLRY